MRVQLQLVGVRELQARFGAILSNDLPISMAASLTRTSVLAQKAVREIVLPAHFILRRAAWASSAIRITPATKASWVTEVTDINPYMGLQETGGTKIPFRDFIAVPMDGARSSPGALISPSNLPHAVMASGGFIRNHIMFKVISRGHGATRGQTIVAMYALVKQASIKPRYRFVEAVRDIFTANWAEQFSIAWQQFNK